MTERARSATMWIIFGVTVPASLALSGALLTLVWNASAWNAKDLAQADAFVDFRKETKHDLSEIRLDIGDIRLALCAMNPGKCKSKSATVDGDGTRRASAQ